MIWENNILKKEHQVQLHSFYVKRKSEPFFQLLWLLCQLLIPLKKWVSENSSCRSKRSENMFSLDCLCFPHDSCPISLLCKLPFTIKCFYLKGFELVELSLAWDVREENFCLGSLTSYKVPPLLSWFVDIFQITM